MTDIEAIGDGVPTFIFRALVRQPGGSNVAAVPATADTTVVEIDDVLLGRGFLSRASGLKLTVRAKGAAMLTVGQRVIFFVRPVLYAENIAVQAIDVWDWPGTGRGMKEARELARELLDAPLVERLRQANLVVIGEVTGIDPSWSERGKFRTFHDPRWARADLEIRRTLTGRTPKGLLPVWFSQSRDVAFWRCPRLSVGQHSIFLLGEAAPDGAEGYIVLDSLDVHPLGEESRLEHLLRHIQAKDER